MREGKIVKYFVFLCLLVVCACDETKVPLTGKREYVLQGPLAEAAHNRKSVSSSLPSAVSINAWEQPKYGTTHVTPVIKGPKNYNKIWEVSLSYGEDTTWKISAPLIVGNKRLFVLDAGGILSALDTTTGELLWTASTTPQRCDGNLNGSMVYANGRVYIGTTFSEVIAYDDASGRILWRHHLDAPAAGGLTIENGHLFVLLSNNTLKVLNSDTGITLWTHKGLMEDAKMIGNAACAVAQGIVIVPYSSGELFALHEETGSVLWEESLTKFASADLFKLFPHIRAYPIISHETVYAVGYSGVTAAFDIRTGTRHWECEVGGSETPCIAKNTLWVVNTDGLCVCINAANGALQWKTTLPIAPERSPATWQGPLMVDGHLLVSHPDGVLVFLSPQDGRIVRHYALEDPIAAPPLILRETLFVVTKNGKVQAYR
jgi:outer membrane protein assembly factor BamB